VIEEKTYKIYKCLDHGEIILVEEGEGVPKVCPRGSPNLVFEGFTKVKIEKE